MPDKIRRIGHAAGGPGVAPGYTERVSMPTPTKGARMGGSPAHQKHILANLAASLFEHGKITTTEARARRLRPYAEKLITFAKRGDMHARRQVLTVVPDKSIVHNLFTEIGPSFADRPVATPASPRSAPVRATPPRWRSSNWSGKRYGRRPRRRTRRRTAGRPRAGRRRRRGDHRRDRGDRGFGRGRRGSRRDEAADGRGGDETEADAAEDDAEGEADDSQADRLADPKRRTATR